MSGKERFDACRQPINHLGAPLFTLLPIENLETNPPVQQDQSPVNRQRCAQLRRLNPAFHLCGELP